MNNQTQAFRRTFTWHSIRRSLLCAALVGTIVNGINQGPEVLPGHLPVLWKAALTYLVPFIVVSYGTFSAFQNSHR